VSDFVGCQGAQPFRVTLVVEPAQSYIQSNVAGHFRTTPAGCILHGSRSGRSQSTHAEFVGTSNWAGSNPAGLGWNATVGSDEICTHMDPNQWGHNARAASDNYLAIEFAQPTVADAIDDGQVRAFAWWWSEVVEAQWPGIGRNFPTHAELETWGETGFHDGKSDVYPAGDSRADELRSRILAALP
jgi:hypothetical protein